MTVPATRSQPYRRKNNTWRQVKNKAINLLQKAPWFWRPLAWGRKLQKGYTFKAKAGLAVLSGRRKGYYGPSFDVDRILWIDPHQVVYLSQREFNVSDFKGRVLDGDWDLLEKKFDDLDICAAIREVCQEGKPWSETLFYQRALVRLNKGLSTWHCDNQADFDQRCRFLERLYRSIGKQGYKTQAELARLQPRAQSEKGDEEEIGVNIGRNGNLLFSDGGHRLAISKTLGLQKIPVKAVVRHAGWAETRKRLLRYSKMHDPQVLPPWPHPDLNDIPCNLEYESLFEIILDDMLDSNGTMLDIGAQFGYFCHRFEEKGMACYALEEGQEEMHFLQMLRRATNKKFSVFQEPVQGFEPPAGLVFDAILVLNRFLQVERQPESLMNLLNGLSRLNFNRLYVLSACHENPVMQSRRKECAETDPLAVMARQLGFKSVLPLDRLDNGVTLYVLIRG